MTKITSKYVLELINDITIIHNNVQKGDLFTAGFNLCFFQQCLINMLRGLEEKEKND